VGEVERYPAGTFCWVELATDDVESAKAFYSALHGWELDDTASASSGGSYVTCRVGGREVAGMAGLGTGGRPAGTPFWNLYVAVDDVDSVTAAATELGARMLSEPVDLREAGRMAVLRDPVGAVVSLWQARRHVGARVVNEVGTWTWNDLATSDPAPAREFYTRLFGWEAEVVAEDRYTSLSKGPYLIGGILRFSEGNAHLASHWLPYFVVADADDTARRIGELGGELVVPVNEVPAGRYAVIRDPSGTPSAIFEMGPEGASRGVDGS
jgi:predicted enzyme related to lactoylglutathione lyase